MSDDFGIGRRRSPFHEAPDIRIQVGALIGIDAHGQTDVGLEVQDSSNFKISSEPLWNELVAKPWYGKDESGLSRICLQLLTQAGDVHIDGTCECAGAVSPDLRQQFLA